MLQPTKPLPVMKIIITGFAGMIGSNLTKALLEEGHEVLGIDNFWRGSMNNINLVGISTTDLERLTVVEADLAAPGPWSDYFKIADIVIHLADIVAGCSYVFSNEGSVFRQNLLINANVASAVELGKPERYIYVGTACSFPKELQTGVDSKPLEESDQLPASPESGYGWSKLMGELDAEYLHRSGATNALTLILHNVYGWPCKYDDDRAQAIPALCFRAITSSNGELDVWGDGSQGRAFVHVTDVVRAILLSIKKDQISGKIQIGPSECTSIRKIANIISDNVSRISKINYLLDKPIGDRGRSANYARARDLLGWHPTILIADGIRDLISKISDDLNTHSQKA